VVQRGHSPFCGSAPESGQRDRRPHRRHPVQRGPHPRLPAQGVRSADGGAWRSNTGSIGVADYSSKRRKARPPKASSRGFEEVLGSAFAACACPCLPPAAVLIIGVHGADKTQVGTKTTLRIQNRDHCGWSESKDEMCMFYSAVSGGTLSPASALPHHRLVAAWRSAAGLRSCRKSLAFALHAKQS